MTTVHSMYLTATLVRCDVMKWFCFILMLSFVSSRDNWLTCGPIARSTVSKLVFNCVKL